jgi:hypothetical protein
VKWPSGAQKLLADSMPGLISVRYLASLILYYINYSSPSLFVKITGNKTNTKVSEKFI